MQCGLARYKKTIVKICFIAFRRKALLEWGGYTMWICKDYTPNLTKVRTFTCFSS